MPRSEKQTREKNEPNPPGTRAGSTARTIQRVERVFRRIADFRNKANFEDSPVPVSA
jgi:hypothetical protein